MNNTKSEGWSISGIPGDNYIMKSDGRNRVAVAVVGGWPGITPEEHEGNKRLIAAAPDLLEACKVVCQMFDDEVFIYGVDDRDKVLKWLRQAARAIAKATTQKEGAK